MNPELNLSLLLQGLSIAILVWGVRGIFGMNKKLNQINGSIGKLWQWKEDHEKLDNTKFHEVDKKVETLFNLWNAKKEG